MASGPLVEKGTGYPEDAPIPSGIAGKISEVLADADEQAGEYSFGGQAETLPPAPGLFVDEIGSIPVPITDYHAQKLIEKCKKSPFGHNLETKMDETVRQSWQLEPAQVKFENMTWQSGIDKLRAIIAARLGYKDIPLQLVLYKLLVYGEGGHFVKHQDTEKEDGMIATLVIQLPSSHEGGDLVVYHGGEVRHRHDFGKADGTSAFLPHYAVHYADAEHAVEKVTKGYRLVLVYSICLPPTMRHLEKDHDKPLSEDLAHLIGSMEDSDEPFALLLSHDYTAKSIQDLGTRALKGIDSARFHALEEANALVPEHKRLELFIVQLTHKIQFEPDRCLNWKPGECKESIRWYSVSGDSLGQVRRTSTVINFLNPGRETLSGMWALHGHSKEEGYMGNEGPTKSTKYARYAIVSWPSAKHLEHAKAFMALDVVIEILYAQKPVDAPRLREFLKAMGARAAKSPAKILTSSEVAGLLVKWVVCNSTNSATGKMIDELKQLDSSQLGPPILEKSLEHFNGVEANDDKFGLLKLLVSKRTEWLKSQIDRLDKPFSWEMPDAQFSDNAKVEEFLRGPAETMIMTKAVEKLKNKDFQDASNYAAKWTREIQVGASFKMVASSANADAVVTIT
ncbi:unnamed protein product [Phytophthora fragariaefolia]|uniref:Unnamed protein product n=1 Tax=Phytophthora fragariaefolia TaxID=1490495 RepID=A0A9W7CFT3_9STRA|nr:unnamed protein product [Phytophthora fragariaefolia]